MPQQQNKYNNNNSENPFTSRRTNGGNNNNSNVLSTSRLPMKVTMAQDTDARTTFVQITLPFTIDMLSLSNKSFKYTPKPSTVLLS